MASAMDLLTLHSIAQLFQGQDQFYRPHQLLLIYPSLVNLLMIAELLCIILMMSLVPGNWLII
jgi:hypothetical protein